ncbi:MAG: hypothetical protein EOL87_11215 [Spartobacteria bacterium]|nr:hypothetical protein [Spartobacteria bacterium]
MKRFVAAGISFLLLGTAVQALAPPSDDVLYNYSRVAKIVASEVPYLHVNKHRFDDSIATNALGFFIDSMDYDHTYFLQSDIDGFSKKATQLDNMMRSGDLTFAFEVYDVFMQRVSNRVDFVDMVLDKGFDFERPEQYLWKRKDAPWAVDEADWDNLWRKKVKNQVLTKRVSNQLAEEERALQAETNSMDVVTDIATADADELAEVVRTIEPETTEEQISKQYQQFYEVMRDNDAHWLLPLFINSFVRAYDPHSDYMSMNSTEDFDISMKLSLVGIGALLSTEDGAAKIVQVIPGGPAEKDGRLKAGDRIIAVGQGDEEPVSIMHWPLSKSVRLIRGEKNTKVVLEIIPASDPSGSMVKRVDLIRAEVKLEDRAAKGEVREVLDANGIPVTVGVITVPDFYADMKSNNGDARSVTKDVRMIIEGMLASNKIDGLILDLRNNGGGSLPEAIQMTGLFIDTGPVVQVKSDDRVFAYPDSDKGVIFDGPLIVMVNRQSASASEILAGALQDYGRAILVGDSKTHGKGTVQSLVPLRRRNPRLGSLKITTQGFYRIAGGSTQLKGVEPDITIPSLLDYMDLGEEFLPGALEWSQVKPVSHDMDDRWEKWLGELTLRSEARRAGSDRFHAYSELLDYLGARRQAGEVTLVESERLPVMKKEKEMAEYIASAEEEGAVPDPVDPADDDVTTDDAEEVDAVDNDLILDEVLQIMHDMVELSGGTALVENAQQ